MGKVGGRAMTALTFTVPGDPVGKGRPRATARGGFARMYTPAATSSYEAKVATFALQVKPEGWPMDCAYNVTIEASFTIPNSWSQKKRAALIGSQCCKKPDWDNIGKIVSDSLNGVLWKDDAQVIGKVVKVWADVGMVRVSVVADGGMT
jgi:Holliday junction resolvase RusA-like endonuclease